MHSSRNYFFGLYASLFILLLSIGCSHSKGSWRPKPGDKAASGHTHIIEKGDTLFSLSKLYSVSVDEIARANNLDLKTPLMIGQPIFVPGAEAKNLPRRPPPSSSSDNDNRTIALGWPVDKGVLFRTFDQTPTRLHEGLSIGAPSNTPVFAAQDGEVLFASDANNHLGKMVIIKHSDPFVSIYGHLEAIKVSVGKIVKKGELIGTVGSSGGVESPRVYFQIRKNRMPVNPEPYLSKPS